MSDPPQPVELPAEAERDGAAGVAAVIAHPETEVLTVVRRRQAVKLTAGEQQRHAGVAEAEGRQLRELVAELERQLAAVHECVDGRHGLQIGVLEPRVGDSAEGLREGLDLLRLDRQAGRRRVAAPALEVAGAVAKRVVQVEGRDRPA